MPGQGSEGSVDQIPDHPRPGLGDLLFSARAFYYQRDLLRILVGYDLYVQATGNEAPPVKCRLAVLRYELCPNQAAIRDAAHADCD
ncbi:hypothetical protein SBA4_1610027 [Candidatus Sulfopaludibacter sp. SbA4]|nr:hypothetical protein SBA4_1610027 [Candidatus Sulfopaludibacter sp. SbA4]